MVDIISPELFRLKILFSMKAKIVTFLMSVAVCYSCAGADKKEIKASEIIKLVKDGKPVQMVDKIILDDLDFTTSVEPYIVTANMLQCDIPSNIFFEGCVFMGKVTSNSKNEKTKSPVHSCFRSNLVFTGCDFRGEVDFNGAVVFGMVNFNRSVFRAKACFNNIAVWAKDCSFSEMNTEKEFMMISASFAGNIDIIGSVFSGNTSFQLTSVKGTLMFRNSSFKDRAGLDLMETGGDAFFNNVTFAKTANFSWSRFMNTVNFSNATFEDKANFEKTFFLNTVNFEGIDRTRLILTDTFFLITE